jgi:shikimate dehydrogenase
MRKYGLIGYPLSHSFSKTYFAEKFRDEAIIDAVYENFSIPSIDELDIILRDNPDLRGLNVTIPYKQAVIPKLHNRDHLPLNACNCIKIESGQLAGYNTDIIGFEKSLSPMLQPHHRHALVLGKGGAAMAVNYVLDKLGILHTTVTRHPGQLSEISYQDLTGKTIRENKLIINTTPVGMFPRGEECPDIPYAFIDSGHYLFDLIYNPAQTLFLQKGTQRGALTHNGSDMLVIQAEESWRIWNSD